MYVIGSQLLEWDDQMKDDVVVMNETGDKFSVSAQ